MQYGRGCTQAKREDLICTCSLSLSCQLELHINRLRFPSRSYSSPSTTCPNPNYHYLIILFYLSIMKTTSFLLFGALLLTSGALASISYTAKMAHRGAEVPAVFSSLPHRHHRPKQPRHGKRQHPINNTLNWAGAIQEAPTSGLFYTVSASWQVPSISTPVGQTLGTDAYWLYEWVGIDSLCGAILQAGTGAYVSRK
jgi:hypothetical protein